MNQNLERLKALVAETNEVVANLNKETENIREGNQEERLKKYVEIRTYLMECVEITKNLGTWLKVKVDIPEYSYIGYPSELFLMLNYDKKYPIKLRTVYVDRRGDTCSSHDIAFVNEDKVDLPYSLNDHNKRNFIDNWNQEVFEKRFAAEVERAITEKANKANEKYQTAVNSQNLLNKCHC